jgi:hypothetical protein
MLIQHKWVVLAYNFNIVILVLINGELTIGAFLLTLLLQFYPCYYLALPFYSCSCWVSTISVLNLAILPCYSNLLFRRGRWIGILRWGVPGYVLPWLPFLWSYGVFRYSISLRAVIVFRDITYVIIILYSWHLVFWEPFWPLCGTIYLGSCIRWVFGFGMKTRYDTSGTRAMSTVGTLA